MLGFKRFETAGLFHQATGMTLVDYLARYRIEKAKNLLQDPHLRTSEVALEVGFQSLSQFNRSFRRIEGQSPKQYRAGVMFKLPRGGIPRKTGRILDKTVVEYEKHPVFRRWKVSTILAGSLEPDSFSIRASAFQQKMCSYKMFIPPLVSLI
jgi:hypothetical protein